MSTPPSNPYVVLGVPADASAAEISHAYRTLLRRHHPDTRASQTGPRSAATDRALQQILSAYAVLRDPVRRAEYDKHAAIRDPGPLAHGAAPTPAVRATRPFIRAGAVHWQPSQSRGEQGAAPDPIATLLHTLIRRSGWW